MKTKFYFYSFLLSSTLILFFACSNPVGKTEIVESPSQGNIKISVDESFKLLYDAEIFVFQNDYPNAKITPLYKPEADVYDDFMNTDSINNVVMTKTLTENDSLMLMKKQLIAKTVKVAQDAIAIIVNPKSKVDKILVSDIEKIFKGQISNWNQVDKNAGNTPIKIVFDNKKSANLRYFNERFNLQGNFTENLSAVESNEEVVKFVNKNPSAFGILSVNWISDSQDSVSNKFLQDVKVLEVGHSLESACKPYQGYIANDSYPIIRNVYMISKESFNGLGTGFAAFVAGEKGQRIILKSGLIPATMPIRLIQVKK